MAGEKEREGKEKKEGREEQSRGPDSRESAHETKGGGREMPTLL